jgi:hypothetical protein
MRMSMRKTCLRQGYGKAREDWGCGVSYGHFEDEDEDEHEED